MKTRTLGDGLAAAEIGLGCMGMADFYGKAALDSERGQSEREAA